MHKGHSGASLGGRQEVSPAKAKRAAQRRRRQDQAWAQRAGEVATSYACICPREGCRAPVHVIENVD